MDQTFRRVVLPEDADAAIAFLCASEWPFHSHSRLSPVEAGTVPIATDDVESFWILEAANPVGLIRLLDLDDVEDGSPLFDLRVDERHRGRGLGRAAVRWLTAHLFSSYPELHRIEAMTRHDNVAMRSVMERCGYRLEGELRESWNNDDGSRSDTMLYGILRHEWVE